MSFAVAKIEMEIPTFNEPMYEMLMAFPFENIDNDLEFYDNLHVGDYIFFDNADYAQIMSIDWDGNPDIAEVYIIYNFVKNRFEYSWPLDMIASSPRSILDKYNMIMKELIRKRQFEDMVKSTQIVINKVTGCEINWL
jgi:hypothetical protein